MNVITNLLDLLGNPIISPEEETYILFAQDLPCQNLGFVDAKAQAIELTIAGRDLVITQSPGLLSSNRAGGTTGAVLWKITPLLAEWLSSATCPLFTASVLGPDSVVLELGCGISGLIGLLLGPRVRQVVLTDQPYVARFLRQNLVANTLAEPVKAKRKAKHASLSTVGNLYFEELDWETDEVSATILSGSSQVDSFDVVVACDCIYNEALIEPFVSTCVAACKLRHTVTGSQACVCVIAQQLRDPDIFDAWMTCAVKYFYIWRVPDHVLTRELRSNSGLVVHMSILKEAVEPGQVRSDTQE